MCYAILVVTYRNGSSLDDRPIKCHDEAELAMRLRETQGRIEADQIDVFKHDVHQSVKRVEEWRSRALVAKPEPASSNRPVDLLPASPPTVPQVESTP